MHMVATASVNKMHRTND